MRARFFCSALAILALIGCGGSSSGTGDPQDKNTLVVLAGSEVQDLEPVLKDVEKHTGVRFVTTYSGTIAGIDRLEGDPHAADVAWFAQDKYLGLVDKQHLLKQSTKIMLSPVILGVKRSKAEQLGWTTAAPSWGDITRAVAAGRFRYAMTNPTTSNSGFSAVISVATAFSGNGDVVDPSTLNRQRLTQFFSGQKLIAGSSGWLADAYVASQASLDGIVNYESVLIDLNRSGRLREPLALIYPKDGVLTADYPMVLINPEKADAYTRVVNYLRTPDVQRTIMTTTYRRPVIAGVPLSKDFPKAVLVETSFPNSAATVDQILLAYLNEHRLAGHSIFVIDTSGSMDGDRLNSVKEAFHILTGSQDTLTGRFARFADREKITIVDFAGSIKETKEFTMHGANDPQTFRAIDQYADSLSAGGNTAIYDALEIALTAAQKDPDSRYDSIVLMTDGENNRGEDASAFEARYPSYKRKVRIFPVIVGEASPEALKAIADLSGGRSFDARSTSLAEIFKEIRGYQ
jgi:Ca-activated chloride channel family protein